MLLLVFFSLSVYTKLITTPPRTPRNFARSVLPPKSIPQYCLDACHTKMTRSDIIMANWTAGVFAPAHAASWDRNTNNIDVSIR